MRADDRTDGTTHLTRPLPKQVRWQDCEVGVIFHFDISVYRQGGWTDDASIHQTWAPEVYRPDRLDTDQWLEAARALGARYAIFTATHFNGFLQWPSDLYPYGVRQAPWRNGRGDVVGDFVNSCRRVGILPGLYLSCFRNAYWKVDRYRVHGGRGGPEQVQFARTCEGMVEELCSRYGPLLQIWFDAGLISPEEGGPDLLPIVDRHQPEMLFYHSPQRREHRWAGNEEGVVGDPCWATMPDLRSAEAAHKGQLPNWQRLLAHGDPDGRLWSPAMADTVLRHHDWFWRPEREQTIKPLDRLVSAYYASVGRNANLVLGLTPGPDGLLPDADLQRCAEFGAEVRRRFARPLATSAGEGDVLQLDLAAATPVDHVVLMEDITRGERIREHVVEGRARDGSWIPLAQATSVGHKRIHRFSSIPLSAIRLRVTQAVSRPALRQLAVHLVG